MASNRQMNHIRNKSKAYANAKSVKVTIAMFYLPWVIFGIVLWVIDHA